MLPCRHEALPVIFKQNRGANGSSNLAATPSTTDLHELYLRYNLSIRRRIERHFGSGPPDPEDAVQAAFERFAQIENRNEIIDPGAFLHRSARNFVIDHLRAQKIRTSHAQAFETFVPRTVDFDAERVLSAKERLGILESAIRGMDDKRRDVLIMNRIHGLSCADIARRLGCSPTLVKMRLAEAVARCQQALRAADDEA